MPLVLRDGLRDLGGIGWGRGLVDERAVRPAAGAARLYRLHPGAARSRHHHPACLRGAVRDWSSPSLVLHEKPTVATHHRRRNSSSPACWCSAPSRLRPSAGHGVGGDLLFVTAGLFWATFGTLLRLWHVPGTRAVGGRRRFVDRCSPPIYLLHRTASSALTAAWLRSKICCRSSCKAADRRRAADLSVRARRDRCSAAAAPRPSRRWCRCSA